MNVSDLPPRIAAKIRVADNGCWVWTAMLDYKGYGRVFVDRQHRNVAAHRHVHALLFGPPQPGLVADHQCHNSDPTCAGGVGCLHRRCVNPAHIKFVTVHENNFSSPTSPCVTGAARTHCKNGHEFTPENTHRRGKYRTRACRACHAAGLLRGRGERRRNAVPTPESARLRSAMSDLGITQAHIGSAVGIKQWQVSERLRGLKPWLPGEIEAAWRLVESCSRGAA